MVNASSMIGTSYQHYLLALLAVANNIPAIAPFLTICDGLDKKTIRRLVYISTFSAFLIMTISMFFGTDVLEFFGITISAFQIAGGLLLCNTGLSMLNAKSSNDVHGKQMEEEPDASSYSRLVSAAIVPITLPLTTGAGTISTVTLFTDAARDSHTRPELFAAILTVTVVVFIIFYFANNMVKFLGDVGMSVLIKVMGLFTLAIGVQFIATGISKIYLNLIH
jgi:multiple antibiotic resistance protein